MFTLDIEYKNYWSDDNKLCYNSRSEIVTIGGCALETFSTLSMVLEDVLGEKKMLKHFPHNASNAHIVSRKSCLKSNR